MKAAALLLATVLPLCIDGALAQSAKTIEPADIANLKRVATPQLSPDGKTVAYVVETPVAAGTHRDAHIWLVPVDGSAPARLFILSDGADTDPRWSPDGSSIAFLSDRKNPISLTAKSPLFPFSIADAKSRPDLDADADAEAHMQLWLISMRGGEAVPLTNIPGGIKAYRWSHDGKTIAFIRRDQDSKPERDRKKAKNDEVAVDQNYKYDRLWLYSLDSHEASLLTKADSNIDAFDWSPDDKSMVARVSPTPRIDDYWRVSRIVTLNTASGAEEKTLEEHAGYQEPRWSPDGHRIYFSRMTAKQITDEHVIYDLDSGKATLLEQSFPGTFEQAEWLPDGKALLAQAIEHAHSEVLRVDAASGKSEVMPDSMASDGEISVAKDQHTFVFRGQTPTQPDEIWLYANGKPRVLTDSNPLVKDWKLPSEREVSWKSTKDGRTIYGIVDLPPGYESGKKYPAIVHIHGGPEEAWTIGFHGNWYNYAAMLASHGYVVLLPDPRGSDGQGPAFTEADFQDWGGGDFQDIMDGVDSIVAQGIADPDRLAIGGWSFGGFMTSWTVTHTNRFKAGMVGAGVTDLFSMATTTDIAPRFETTYFGDLQPNRKLYDEHSPIRYITDCHTPVLVLHGEADPRVPISQGEEFYHALRFLGRDAVMVRYPREPHIFTEREHQIDSLTRILAWYDAHLRH
jgi:dipeptidyl aminopeptidase/acylaminoacyl peptidase